MLTVVAVCSSVKLLQNLMMVILMKISRVCWCFILGLKMLVLIVYDEVQNESTIMKLCSVSEDMACVSCSIHIKG